MFAYASWFQLSYGALPGQLPDRITWCGRDYARESGPSRDVIDGYPVGRRVTHVPHLVTLWWVYMSPNQDQTRSYPADVPCTFMLYLKTGTATYVRYGLQGGP